MRLLVLILVVLFVLLQHRLWVGDGGIVTVTELRDAVEAQQQENRLYRERNQRLQAEVRDLKEGLAAVEERARKELGMIRRGETFYQLVDE